MGATGTGHFSITVGNQFRKGGPIVVAVAAEQGHTATQLIAVQLQLTRAVNARKDYGMVPVS
jgi:hypothetical protein